MRKFFLVFLFLLCPFVASISLSTSEKSACEVFAELAFDACNRIYTEMELDGVISREAFESAYQGYEKLTTGNKSILTIIDFSLPSTAKRLYVLDMVNRKLLFNSYVSHGKNSGDLYATSFSNHSGSHKSSLGFYETENTYMGSNGYSLILNGLEQGINDKAKARAIVMHGAKYCTASVISSSGRLGRSFGCPSVPPELTKPIINTIKGGTLLYIYARDRQYLTQSRVVGFSDAEAARINERAS